MQKSRLSVIETLPPDLQTKVYHYALSLAEKSSLAERSQESFALVLDMHEGTITMTEDFDDTLPDAF